jgi:hypothetical protein
MGHRRAPGVEHGSDADPGPEVFFVGADRDCRLGRRLEKKVVDHALVLVGDVGDRTGERVHEVEVADGQELGLALGEPLLRGGTLALGAVAVATAVVGDDRVGTGVVLATRNMASERRGAAALDRAHHLQLGETHMPGIGATPSGPVVAEDIRDLESVPNHGAGLCGWLSFAPGPCLPA